YSDQLSDRTIACAPFRRGSQEVKTRGDQPPYRRRARRGRTYGERGSNGVYDGRIDCRHRPSQFNISLVATGNVCCQAAWPSKHHLSCPSHFKTANLANLVNLANLAGSFFVARDPKLVTDR